MHTIKSKPKENIYFSNSQILTVLLEKKNVITYLSMT